MTATPTGTAHEARIPLPDGCWLAASLYLPAGCDAGSPAPVLLEALPYRKDDLTSSYRPEYVRFRDEHGFAVCRVDLRGTGSSPGTATDEYPAQEQADLVVAIDWLAGQEWSTGAVGMFGTSWSGFNAIQAAMQRPAALKAICASYATDDRWTDDVHYYGGSLRLLDQVDYPLYMLAMNALPPVPAVHGEGWREEWLRRLGTTPPWQLTWLREQRRDPYWRHGSLRPGYERIEAATMLVVGWADGYRNNSLRTARALHAAGTPVSVLAGPWSHQAPLTAVPGPNVDHVPVMAAWFDRHLRDGRVVDDPGADDRLTLFVRSWAPPAPDAPAWAGRWIAAGVADLDARTTTRALVLGTPGEVRDVRHAPDVGLAAWNSCAGAQPWGQPADQRGDDVRTLHVDHLMGATAAVIGAPVARLRVRPEADRAAVAVRLCAVGADGTSVLVSRGLLNLSYRDGLTGEAPLTPTPVEPGRWYDVEVELETCAYAWGEGETLRLSIGVTEWPNAVAPPVPQGIAVDLGASSLALPVVDTAGLPEPALPAPPQAGSAPSPADPAPSPAGSAPSPADPAPSDDDGSPDDDSHVRWWSERDVLARTTSAHVDHGARYAAPYDARCAEHYVGTVEVRDDDWAQRATASTTFEVSWPQVSAVAVSTLDLVADAGAYDVTLTLRVTEDGEPLHERRWHERLPRSLG